MLDKSMLKSANESIAEHTQPTFQLASLGQGENVPTEGLIELEPLPSYRPQPEVITGKALGEMQHRWSVTPLYTKNYKYARNTEMMMDEYSGETAVKLSNGKILMGQEGGRLKYHLMQFESDLSYYGMRNSIINNIVYDDDSYTHLAKVGTNLLDSSIYIDEQTYLDKLCISLDIDIFLEEDDTPKMQISHVDPEFAIEYRVDGGKRHKYRCKLSEFRLTSELVHTMSIEIESITMMADEKGLLDNAYSLVHSILVAVTEA